MNYLNDYLNACALPLTLMAAISLLSHAYRKLLFQVCPTGYDWLRPVTTLLHELCHSLVVLVFGMRIEKFHLGNETSTAFVAFRYQHNLVHGVGLFFVGLAPLICIIMLMLAVGHLRLPGLLVQNFRLQDLTAWPCTLLELLQIISSDIVTLSLFLLLAVITPMMAPSRTDLKLAFKGSLVLHILMLICVGTLDLFGYITAIHQWAERFHVMMMSSVMLVLISTIFAIVVIGFVYVMQKFLNKGAVRRL